MLIHFLDLLKAVLFLKNVYRVLIILFYWGES